MKYRKLRIAATTVAVTLSLYFAALAVFTHYHIARVSGRGLAGYSFSASADRGRLTFFVFPPGLAYAVNWKYENFPLDEQYAWGPYPYWILTRSGAQWGMDGFMIGVPIWFAAVLAAGLAPLAWLRCRYSLRTLLIAMTLVAVGLGLIVWLRG